MTTTYKKLRDGSWGLIGPSDRVVQGQTVAVLKRSGQEKVELVGRVLWTGDGKAIATIQRNGYRRSQRSGSSGRYECEECGEYVTEGDGSRCWETGAAH